MHACLKYIRTPNREYINVELTKIVFELFWNLSTRWLNRITKKIPLYWLMIAHPYNETQLDLIRHLFQWTQCPPLAFMFVHSLFLAPRALTSLSKIPPLSLELLCLLSRPRPDRGFRSSEPAKRLTASLLMVSSADEDWRKIQENHREWR